MFKQKQKAKANVQHTLIAPVGGLDAISPLMAIPEKRALILDNWFPRLDGLVMRDGFVSHATGFGEAIRRMHVYSAKTGGETLWATTNTGIYNATAAGAIGATVMALTDGRTIATNLATGAGNYLLVVNGVDTLKQYDGTTWTSVATFGLVATSTYSFIEVYRQRVFLAVKNSLDIAYLAPNSISGAASTYNMGATLKKGGYLVAIGTWTIDGGTGPEDNFVAITNKGEIAVFAGSDPATWVLQGVYNIGTPLGANCMFKYGGDLLLLTEDGIYPLSSAIQSAAIDRTSAVSEAVRPLFNLAASVYGDNEGWQIISDPLKPFLLVNVPSTPVKKQFVMHSQSKAWCTFSGIEAICFARLGRELYFGTTTEVCRITGTSDKGANIRATMLQAYTRLRYETLKKVELEQAYLQATGGFRYTLGISSNFKDPRETVTLHPALNAIPALWGTGIFGEALWSGSTELTQDWQSVPDDYSLWKAQYLQVVSNNAKVTYFGTDMLFLTGRNR